MRWFAALLLFLYAAFVCRLTLADPSAGQPVFDAAYYWGELLSGGRMGTARIEMLANVALFLPAGLLLAIVLRRPLVATGLLVVASVCIELAQQHWFPSRVPSLADVEHNGIGAALGALTAWIAVRGSRWLSGSTSSTGQPV
jgi:VanZ family protein